MFGNTMEFFLLLVKIELILCLDHTGIASRPPKGNVKCIFKEKDIQVKNLKIVDPSFQVGTHFDSGHSKPRVFF